MDNVNTFRQLCALLAEGAGILPATETNAGNTATDWNALALLAQEHHVLPLLGSVELAHRLPPDLAEAAQTAAAANENRNSAIARQVLDIGRCLNGAGVTPILLKGAAALLGALYPRIGQRWMGDVDILVPADQLQASEQALCAAGYQPCPDRPGNFDADRTMHHLWPFEHPEHPVQMELHFGVCVPRFEHLIPTPWAWQESEPLNVEGVAFLMLPPRLALLHNFVHNQFQDNGFFYGDIRLRRLLEFALLRHRHPDAPIASWLHAHLNAAGHGVAFSNYLGLADELFLGRAPHGNALHWATRLANTRTWILIRYPSLQTAQHSLPKLRGLARAAFAQSPKIVLKKIMNPQWYAGKWRFLLGGGRGNF